MIAMVTDDIKGGRLVRDVFNSYGLQVLTAGSVIDMSALTLLLKHHIEYVHVEFDTAPSLNSEDMLNK
ncbi:hypothetical protein [Paenibacillus hexagrammi]|uniref:Uncharacterized protein n=1 Tax=Paenibacillus hexagrammi TaxID=2908839 RepID=A0ABY3SP79_9BACL|nr:hypothetical protein [Paenibacillus sp. YPD9-1]UJF35756.1 hypothetical protein L0M14_12095 [Paenibacillus sp. YPD9-1]